MRALDTNVLLRFLLDDNRDQAATVERIFMEGRRSHEHLFITTPVLCEMVWTLKGQGQSKAQIVSILETFTKDGIFRLDQEREVIDALDSHRAGRASFADYLIGHLAQKSGCRDTVTFDKKLKGSPGFTIL